MRRQLSLALFCLPLGACSILDTDVQKGFSTSPTWRGMSAFTTADVRVLTNRKHPVLGNDVVCAEPSPDVAKALSTAAALSLKGGNGAASGELNGGGSSAEAVAELAGRSTALLGLRDGLFRACEAYSNGAIGQDAYALVIARYTQLMTTLFLGQDITSAAAVENRAGVASPVVQASGAPVAATGSPPAKVATPVAGASPMPATPTAVRAIQAQPRVNLTPRTPARFLRTRSGMANDPPYLIKISDPTPAPVAAAAAPPAAVEPPAVKVDPKKAAGSTTQTPPITGTGTPVTGGANGAGTGGVAAIALVRMNEDYIHQSAFDVLLVSCINEYDPTRLGREANHITLHNTFLAPVCAALQKPGALLAAAHEDTTTWRFVNPETGAADTAAPAAASPVLDASIAGLQAALKKQDCTGCASLSVDGVYGVKTKRAIVAFEKGIGISPADGKANDPQLLNALKSSGRVQ